MADNSNLQKEKSSAVSVRSSPRLRHTGNTILEHANTKSGLIQQTLKDSNGDSEQFNTNQIKRDNRKRKSTPVTPDLGNSSTQRELKKLEDYWTRHDPVKEDSPRLRSNRKTKFDLKECLKKGRRTASCSSEHHSNDGDENNYPESPIPVSEATADLQENHSVSTKQSAASKSSNLFEQFSSTNLCELEKSSTKNASAFENENVEYELKAVPPSNTDINYCDSQQSEFSDFSFSCSQTTDECGGCDEDYHIPPRKKLRSEVKKDELWEGFPLGFSFKRLAPLSRKSESECEIKSYTTGVDSQSDLDDSYETSASSPCRKETDSEESEYHVESSLESTIIYAETEFRDSRLDENHRISKLTAEISALDKSDYITNDNHEQFNRETQNHTPQPKRQKKVSLPNTPRKSQRLMEKIKLTPEKPTEIDESAQTLLKKATHVLSFDVKKGIDGKNSESSNKNEYLEESSSNVVPGSTMSMELRQNQGEESSYTITSLEKDNTNFTDKIDGTEKGEIVNISISQILSCERVEVSISTSQENMTRESKSDHSLLSENSSSDVHESVSRVLENLLNIVESKSDCLVENTNCSYQYINSTKMHDTGIKKRRSNRIAVLESKQFLTVKESVKESIQKENKPSIVNEQSLTNLDETVQDCDYPVMAFSKKTTHKEGINKNNKSVPPLRIKLKLPLKCVPNKSKTKEKDKVKSAKTTENKDEISFPSTSKKSPTKSKKKFKKRKKQQGNSSKESEVNEMENTEPIINEKAPIGKKKGYTPAKKKKTKRLKKETTRWSPVTNVTLRINNERRAAAAGKLINNATLDRHACVLWSSENRRHVQLSNSHASTCELDDILRRKWETLSPKEKLRYFQRAQNAVRDENKHSNKRFKDEGGPSTSGSNSDSANPDLVRFLSLDSRRQLSELKNRLHFYREVSPEEYTKVMSSYKASCIDERQAKETKKSEATKPKSKQKKTKRKPSESESKDTHAKYRRLLYEKVCANWEKIVGIWQDKKRVQTSILYDNFKLLIKRLIVGEDVQFCEHTVSVRLSEVLHDLKQLEREKQLVIAGAQKEKTVYGHVMHRLREAPSQVTIQPVTDSLFLDVPIETEVMSELLSDLKEEPLPVIDLDIIQTVLPITDEVSSTCHLVDVCRDVTKPVSVLTDWVVEEAISSNRYLESRGAISLLTNKVVPCSTFVSPQYANGPFVQRDKNNSNKMNRKSFQSQSSPVQLSGNYIQSNNSKQISSKQFRDNFNKVYSNTRQFYNRHNEKTTLIEVHTSSKQSQDTFRKVSDNSKGFEGNSKQSEGDTYKEKLGQKKSKDDNNNCVYITLSPNSMLKSKVLRSVPTQRAKTDLGDL